MLFNSYEFLLVFLPTTLLGFFVLGRRNDPTYALTWLTLASLRFYGWWNPRYLPLIAFSIVFNYRVGIGLTGAGLRGQRQWAGALLAVGVAVNLLLLGYFKYANFFVANAGAFVDADWSLAEITLPIAISFFTFQQVAYLCDARRGVRGSQVLATTVPKLSLSGPHSSCFSALLVVFEEDLSD